MENTERLFYIEEGDLTALTFDNREEFAKMMENCDWVNSAIMIARSLSEATRLVDLYDAGKIDADNCIWEGETISALHWKQLPNEAD